MQKLWAGVLVALGCAAGAPGVAAYCPYGTRWQGPVVDVVLQHQAHQRLCTDDAVPCNTLSRAALETTIRATLDEFYDSSAANLRLRIERAGDAYVLNGEKTSISAADQADAIIVFGRTGSADSGAHGVSAVLVPAGAATSTRPRARASAPTTRCPRASS